MYLSNRSGGGLKQEGDLERGGGGGGLESYLEVILALCDAVGSCNFEETVEYLPAEPLRPSSVLYFACRLFHQGSSSGFTEET